MRILYSSDLHGHKHLYESLFELALKESIDLILIGGDLLPLLRPNFYKVARGRMDFNQMLSGQIKFIDDFLAPKFRGFLKKNPDKSLIYIPGNHDWIKSINHLKKVLPEARCLDSNVIKFKDFYLMGYPNVPDSPFWVKDRVRRDLKTGGFVKSRFSCISTDEGVEQVTGDFYALGQPSIEEELSGLEISDPKKTICIFHSPPFSSGLDTMHGGKTIGSKAIRHFIETKKPFISLHGHVHEGPLMSGTFKTHLADTLCVNAGSTKRKLHAVIFDIDNPSETIMHSIYKEGKPISMAQEPIFDRIFVKLKSIFIRYVLKG